MQERPNSRTAIRVMGIIVLAEAVTAVILAIMLAVYVVFLWKLMNWVYGAVGVLVGLVLIYATYRMFVFAYRRHFQFTLRELLIATAVLALLLGIVIKPALDIWWRHCAVSSVIDAGGSFLYIDSVKNSNPGWTKSHTGYDPFGKNDEIDINTDLALESMADQVKHFAEVKHLILNYGVTDAGLRQAESIRKLPSLNNVSILDAPISDEGLELISKWPQVEGLCINNCSKLSDDGLAHLQRMKKLNYLMLVAEGGGKLNISDAGMIHVGRLPQLETLVLLGVGIGDGGLDQLAKMKHLKMVYLTRTSVTKAGVKPSLQQALPNCEVVWDGVSSKPNVVPQPQPAASNSDKQTTSSAE